jgi:hypothetical protein
MFVALAGLVLAVAVFLPWFKPTVRISGSDIIRRDLNEVGNDNGRHGNFRRRR